MSGLTRFYGALNRIDRGVTIVLLKLVASAVLTLGTLGLLGHEKHLVAFWAIYSKQTWFPSFAHGWYPDVYALGKELLGYNIVAAVIYLSVALLCVIAVFAAPFIANVALRVIVSTILIAGVLYDLVMYDVGGSLPNFDRTYTMISNFKLGVEGASSIYIGVFSGNLALVALPLAVFCIRPPFLPSRFRWVPLAVVVAASVGVAGIFWRTNGYTSAFPSPFSTFLSLKKSIDRDAYPPIGTVDYSGELSSPFRKIVLIVDESVRGDYLSINNRSIDTTPFLLSKADEIINFGIAVSSANCSVESRQGLRFGIRDQDLGSPLQDIYRRPTIWQYAKRAGFQSVYFDTYGTPTTLSHGMTPPERALVDERIVVSDMPEYTRDGIIATKLRQLLSTPTPTFVFVEKLGIHAPYDKTYPASANFFGADTTHPFDLADRKNLVRHYENAIRWSVDDFFSQLLKDGLPPDTLLLYTSDHGQSMSERELATHCNEGRHAVKGEAAVPLFAVTDNKEWGWRLSRGAAVNFGRASHFELYPTILAAMGYDRSWLSKNFDLSLMDEIPSQRRRRYWATGSVQPYDDTSP